MDYECGRYDTESVMARIPELLGMDLTYKKGAWEGRYYIDGERHAYKKDKLKIKVWNSGGKLGIWLHEQGGESMSLTDWLQKYGGANSYSHAMAKILRCEKVILGAERYRIKTKDVRYVPRTDFEALKKFEFERCPLFIWMCGLFGKDRVRETWERYNVCTDTHGNAVYWYVDREGKILHDKRIPYNIDGCRRKDRGAWRAYKVDAGYRGRCLFGEHLIADAETVNVVEGEKSALLATAMWGETKGVWLGTGGKGQLENLLKNVEGKRVRLFPDADAFTEWSKYGYEVVDWRVCMPNMGEKDDIGDFVVWRINERRKI